MADNSTTPTPPSRRPRFVWLALSLVGLAAGLGFGILGARLHFGAPLVMLGLGGMTLGLAALALWRVLEPLVNAEPPRVEAPTEPARVRELQREKQLLLKAIKEIDMDFQMRKLSPKDWEELTHRYRARALRIISELEAGDDYRALIEQELKHRLAAVAAAAQVVGEADAGKREEAGS